VRISPGAGALLALRFTYRRHHPTVGRATVADRALTDKQSEENERRCPT